MSAERDRKRAEFDRVAVSMVQDVEVSVSQFFASLRVLQVHAGALRAQDYALEDAPAFHHGMRSFSAMSTTVTLAAPLAVGAFALIVRHDQRNVLEALMQSALGSARNVSMGVSETRTVTEPDGSMRMASVRAPVRSTYAPVVWHSLPVQYLLLLHDLQQLPLSRQLLVRVRETYEMAMSPPMHLLSQQGAVHAVTVAPVFRCPQGLTLHGSQSCLFPNVGGMTSANATLDGVVMATLRMEAVIESAFRAARAISVHADRLRLAVFHAGNATWTNEGGTCIRAEMFAAPGQVVHMDEAPASFREGLCAAPAPDVDAVYTTAQTLTLQGTQWRVVVKASGDMFDVRGAPFPLIMLWVSVALSVAGTLLLVWHLRWRRLWTQRMDDLRVREYTERVGMQRKLFQDFLRTTSHDMRTPLQSASTALQLLQAALTSSPLAAAPTHAAPSSPAEQPARADFPTLRLPSLASSVTAGRSEAVPPLTTPMTSPAVSLPLPATAPIAPPGAHPAGPHGEPRRDHGEATFSFSSMDLGDPRYLMHIIRSSLSFVAMLLDNAFDFDKLVAAPLRPRLEPLDLSASVREVVRALRCVTSYQRSVPVVEDVAALPVVLCDGPRVLRVLAVLLTNALKFTVSGSIEVRLRGRRVPSQHCAECTCSAPNTVSGAKMSASASELVAPSGTRGTAAARFPRLRMPRARATVLPKPALQSVPQPGADTAAVAPSNDLLCRCTCCAGRGCSCKVPWLEVELTVTDTGVGMTAEQLQQACEPFVRRRREEGGGWGLGLYVCREFVRMQGGSMVLRSTPGEGTQVCVTLPMEVVAAAKIEGHSDGAEKDGCSGASGAGTFGAVPAVTSEIAQSVSAEVAMVALTAALSSRGALDEALLAGNAATASALFPGAGLPRSYVRAGATAPVVPVFSFAHPAPLIAAGQKLVAQHSLLSAWSEPPEPLDDGKPAAPDLTRCDQPSCAHSAKAAVDVPVQVTEVVAPRAVRWAGHEEVHSRLNGSSFMGGSVPITASTVADSTNPCTLAAGASTSDAVRVSPPVTVPAGRATLVTSALAAATPPAPLPAIAASSAAPTTLSQRSSVGAEHLPLRVLLVDDAQLNLKLLARVLDRLVTHPVSTAVDGAQALQLMQEQQFDVVFMDLNMPVMDGCEATRALRAWEAAQGVDVGGVAGRRRTFVCALTGDASEYDASLAQSSGCDMFLTKPCAVGTLKDVLRRGSSTQPKSCQ